MIATKPLKQKACKNCKTKFMPISSWAAACSPLCGLELARSKRLKAEKAEKVKDKRETKAKLEKHKKRGEWLTEAQTEFNKFIRARDAGKPCICCGKPFEPQKPGGSADAGHYLSRGAAPHLRFVENNVHAQRKNCNRPGGTTRIQFRAGMIERIGLEAVEALEADQTPRNYTIDDLREIKRVYTAKARELKVKQS